MFSRLIVLAATAAAALLLVAGCGSDSKPAVCTARDDLQKSVDSLKDLDLLQAGPAGVESAFNDVKTNATTLADETKAKFPTQTDSFTKSLDNLQDSIDGVSGGSISPSQVATLASRIQSFVTATQNLGSSIQGECD